MLIRSGKSHGKVPSNKAIATIFISSFSFNFLLADNTFDIPTKMNETGVLNKLEECVLELHRVGVVKFGDFTLKSGMQSPVYFDLRMIISIPKLMVSKMLLTSTL